MGLNKQIDIFFNHGNLTPLIEFIIHKNLETSLANSAATASLIRRPHPEILYMSAFIKIHK